MSSAQERAILTSTLACLIKSLTNKRTTVELRNESFVTGKVGNIGLLNFADTKPGFTQIVHSDGFMNISMEDVLFTDALGQKSKFDSFFVQNRLVRYDTCVFVIESFKSLPDRYVQIPKHVNIQQSLEEVCQPQGGRGRGRGRGEVSRGRMKILGEREQRRQEDLKNALKMKEEWKMEKERREKQ